MEDLQRMVIFARVVEERSFTRAARRLGCSKSLVSKEVSQLERSLGARLLHRTTRASSLTEAGAIFYEHCARIVEEQEEARLAVGRLHAAPRGLLRLTVPVSFGRLHVAPALATFLERHPEVRVDLTTTDRLVDLAEEGCDLAIRITDQPAPTLVAPRLAPVRRKLVATPGYFARHGMPETPADLERHNCLTYTHFNPQDPWRLHGPDGDISVRASGNLRVNDDDALAAAVVQGLGVALLPTFLIGTDLQAGRLQAALSQYIPVERHIYAVYLANRHVPAKVRAFIDFLRERFGPKPYWDR